MRRSSPRYSSPSRGQTWWINLYLAHSAAAHALFPSSPLLSLFLKCQASCHPKGYAGCISVSHSPVDSRVKCQRLPPFLTAPPALCVASARCQTPRFISHLHLLLTLFSDWWFNLTLEEVCHSPHHLSTYVPLISCQSHGVGEAVMNSSSCGRSLTVCRWSTSPCSPLYAASNR